LPPNTPDFRRPLFFVGDRLFLERRLAPEGGGGKEPLAGELPTGVRRR